MFLLLANCARTVGTAAFACPKRLVLKVSCCPAPPSRCKSKSGYLALGRHPSEIVLSHWVSHTANSIQVDPLKAGSSASSPAAITPDGNTSTDTFPHVKVAEDSHVNVTTAFIGSTVVEKSDDRATTFAPPSYIAAMSTEFIMTLKKALCRPISIDTGSWTTADVVGTNLSTNALPEALLTQTIVQKKLDGFQGIRGSITLRLQASANPTQQGRLKLCFYPMAGDDPTYASRAADPSSWSFWPSVDLDLAVETACELRVPFLLPVSFCDLITNVYQDRPQMGYFSVKVYSPLKVGLGTNTVGWNLYAHWNEDDLQLINPTINSYQSGSSRKIVAHHHPPSEVEGKKGTISGALDAGATLAEVASHVPVLSTLAGPTAWAARCASRVAAAFGFSRPSIDAPPVLVKDYEMPYASNVEGPDVSMPLSLTVQPLLKIEPKLSGKNEDEMALDYFLTKFGYHDVVNLSTATAAGTNLLNLELGMMNATASELIYPKPYLMLASMFRYWRGNFRIRIKFVKTKLHTARLCFAFFPGVQSPATLADCEYVHRDIVDIAGVDELTYELPFTSRYPYLNTTSSSDLGTYGSFQILVVNALQAPSTVANNIDLVIETAMGAGSEFFQPRPSYDSYPVAQSGDSRGLVRVSTLCDAEPTPHQMETSQLCVGERLMSIRQLIKYPAPLGLSAMYHSTTSTAGGYLAAVYYQPFLIGASSPLGATTAQAGDLLNLLAPYYRFSRGGMRVRGMLIAPESVADAPYQLVANVTTSSQDGLIGDWNGTYPRPFGGDFNIRLNKPFCYTIPSWQPCPMSALNYVTTISSPAQTNEFKTSALVITGWVGAASTGYGLRMTRQPADDYELIGFVGPPGLVTLVSEAKTGTPKPNPIQVRTPTQPNRSGGK